MMRLRIPAYSLPSNRIQVCSHDATAVSSASRSFFAMLWDSCKRKKHSVLPVYSDHKNSDHKYSDHKYLSKTREPEESV